MLNRNRMSSGVRGNLIYLSQKVNEIALAAREISQSEYNTVCNDLAKFLDEKFSVEGTRVFMLNPDSDQNDFDWPIVFKSENVIENKENPATRIELFSQIQLKQDWLCRSQVNGQAFRKSATTKLITLYTTSSILDRDTGLVRYVLKAAVPYE